MKNKTNLRQYYVLLAALALILAMLIMSSCGAAYKAKRCQKLACCEKVKDSTVYISTVKDSVIFIDESQTWIDLLFQCDSANLVQLAKVDRLETENADLKMKWDNGKLTVYVHKIDTVTGKNTEKITYLDKVINVKVPAELTKWQRFWVNAGPWIALIVLLYLAYRIYRMIKKW